METSTPLYFVKAFCFVLFCSCMIFWPLFMFERLSHFSTKVWVENSFSANVSSFLVLVRDALLAIR